MKKLLTALIAVLYMGSSSGIAMEIHYCMGKQSGVEFYGDNTRKCSKCGMKVKKGCCHDQHQFYKIKDAHQTSTTDVSFTNNDIAVITTHAIYNWPLAGINETKALQNHSPPDYSGPSACIMNCVFRL